MAFKTRLDKLVKIRDRAEEAAMQVLARARAGTLRAEDELARARAQAAADERCAGTVARWQDADAARTRALTDVKKAVALVLEAQAAEEGARVSLSQAHRMAEVVRRAAESKCQQMSRAADRAERKVLDELATIQFGRKGP
jgi:flagellar export protein FliJ